MKKSRVLIVDDSAVMRKMVERSLRQAGVELEEVFEAKNGAEALALVRQNMLDLIVSDINMPTMDGLQFVRELQSLDYGKGVPVVIVTTEGSEARVVEALSSGARAYIRKPFTSEQIRDRVTPLLEE